VGRSLAQHKKAKLAPEQLDKVAAGMQLTYKKWRCDSLDSSSDSSDSSDSDSDS
jgi:hypothetical protein